MSGLKSCKIQRGHLRLIDMMVSYVYNFKLLGLPMFKSAINNNVVTANVVVYDEAKNHGHTLSESGQAIF